MGIPDSQIISLNKSRQKAIYWRPNGKGGWMQTTPLPADPMSIQYYFSMGFKGKKPTNGDEVAQPDDVQTTPTVGLIKCPMCEFKAKDEFGFMAHFKVHLKSKKKEEKT